MNVSSGNNSGERRRIGKMAGLTIRGMRRKGRAGMVINEIHMIKGHLKYK